MLVNSTRLLGKSLVESSVNELVPARAVHIAGVVLTIMGGECVDSYVSPTRPLA